MVESLEVLNGTMSPKYDKYNNIYTIQISESENDLKLNYKTSDNSKVQVYGNSNFKIGENKVVLAIKSSEKINYIYLTVYKEQTENAASDLNTYEALNLKTKEEVPTYVAPAIASLCFLLIISFYLLFFALKKRK